MWQILSYVSFLIIVALFVFHSYLMIKNQSNKEKIQIYHEIFANKN
jgi:preprotein translocase subunit YajC